VKVLEAPEAVVVHLKLPGIEPVAAAVPGAAVPGAAAGTEPEIIKKEKKVEEVEE
jgi:hypothetical protein